MDSVNKFSVDEIRDRALTEGVPDCVVCGNSLRVVIRHTDEDGSMLWCRECHIKVDWVHTML